MYIVLEWAAFNFITINEHCTHWLHPVLIIYVSLHFRHSSLCIVIFCTQACLSLIATISVPSICHPSLAVKEITGGENGNEFLMYEKVNVFKIAGMEAPLVLLAANYLYSKQFPRDWTQEMELCNVMPDKKAAKLVARPSRLLQAFSWAILTEGINCSFSNFCRWISGWGEGGSAGRTMSGCSYKFWAPSLQTTMESTARNEQYCANLVEAHCVKKW